MNEPTERYHNALAAALVLGFMPKDHKGKKGKTRCQQKRRGPSERDMVKFQIALPPGASIRQVSRFKFIVTGGGDYKPNLVDLKRRLITPIEKDCKIGRRYAK